MASSPASEPARKQSAPNHAGAHPRVAIFTPLPPANTGTADYAAGLIGELQSRLDLTVLDGVPAGFDPSAFDVLVYQIANNPYHADIYQLALQHPGIVVLHEVNLHHLIQGLTLHKGDEKAYLREVMFEIFGQGDEPDHRDAPIHWPQPSSFTMARRLLGRSVGCIVHSACAAAEVRCKGFRGPVAVIPHGAEVRDLDARACRASLGAEAGSPVVGIFGYQRPDKRIAECLRAFRLLLDVAPGAKLVIAGQPHPQVPLADEIRELNLQSKVRILGFLDLGDWDQWLAACDIVLNLRNPTYGETSGTMMRAFGLGVAVIVSDLGAFRELPDDICLKIPVDAYEYRVTSECLRWLAADLSRARRIGQLARQWVAQECNWGRVADLYAEFIRSHDGGNGAAVRAAVRASALTDPASLRQYVTSWLEKGSEAEAYFQQHACRLVRTLELTPTGTSRDAILELGCYLQITPSLNRLLGYGEVRGSYLGPADQTDRRRVNSRTGDFFECAIDLFNVECDPFPYPDEMFSTVLCCELLEHLQQDPMHMLSEIHRVLKPAGALVLTTPNIASWHSVYSVLQGKHPGVYTLYPRPGAAAANPRHAREYTPNEVCRVLMDAGFILHRLETGPFGSADLPYDDWVKHLVVPQSLAPHLRGPCIFAVARKAQTCRNRFPDWLYEP